MAPPARSHLPGSNLRRLARLAQDLPPEGKQRAVRETQTLLKLQHPNVARYHKAFLYEGRLCYMTDFAEAGTLHHLIYMLKDGSHMMDEALTWHIFIQAAPRPTRQSDLQSLGCKRPGRPIRLSVCCLKPAIAVLPR